MTTPSDLLRASEIQSKMLRPTLVEAELLRRARLFDSPVSRLEQDALRRQQLFEGPFARLERGDLRRRQMFDSPSKHISEGLRKQQHLLDQFTGRSAFEAIRATESVLAGARGSFGLEADLLRSRSGLGEILRIKAQTNWVSSLSANLDRTPFRTLAVTLSTGIEFPELIPRLELAFGSAAREFPDTFDALEDHFPEVAREIAAGVAQAAAGNTALADQSIRGVLAELLSHYRLMDENGRARLVVVLSVILLTIAGSAAGEILGSEWNRFREADAQKQEQIVDATQLEAIQNMRTEVARLRELAEHPPRTASIIRRAHLRAAPHVRAKSLGPVLEVGTDLVIYERADGWVRVEAEPTPGDLRAGWVYGRLAQYE